MLTQVVHGGLHHLEIVLELAQAVVAGVTEKGTNLAGGMVVIDRQRYDRAGLWISVRLRLPADGTKTTLSIVHLHVLGFGDAVSISPPLLSPTLQVTSMPLGVFFDFLYLLHAFLVHAGPARAANLVAAVLSFLPLKIPFRIRLVLAAALALVGVSDTLGKSHDSLLFTQEGLW